MRYKTILWDLDGTLLDTTDGVVAAVKQTVSDWQLSFEGIWADFVGPPMTDSAKKHFALNDTAALAFANDFRANYKKYSLFDATPYEGIYDLLAELNKCGCKMAVATNKSQQNARDVIEYFDLMKYFDCVVGADLQGRLSKKEIINLCMENLSAISNETVLIGDSIYDMNGASQAGIDFIAVIYGFGFKSHDVETNENCVFVANNVNDLWKYFNRCI